MRISDWSSDVCSSDLREAFSNLFQVHGTAFAARLSALGIAFELAEIRLDVAKAPPLGASCLPGIVILCLTSNINHAVDQRRTAQALATRHRYRPPVHIVFRRSEGRRLGKAWVRTG